MKYIVGIDEAGRGPLAGPVAVGMVMVPERFDVRLEFPGVADSKKLSEKNRERIFTLLLERKKMGDVQFCVQFSSPEFIDQKGIMRAVADATARGLRSLSLEISKTRILLDGLLKAPPEYSQKTITRGDETVPLISLASIAAKVMRDRRMVKTATAHPCYGFEKHKGYGTAAHREAIKTYGPSSIHRVTFLSTIMNASMPGVTTAANGFLR